MNLAKFHGLEKPFQSYHEWLPFMEFVSAYFMNRGILNPTVVEIGIYQNLQRPFYKELLNARHIGVDTIADNATPDILGDSTAPETVAAVRDMLAGNPIDLLFIDGGHGYETVKSDYLNYGPMTKHIIAFHDIYTKDVEVKKLWAEILLEKDTNTVEFRAFNSYMGIGIILK